MFRIGLGGNCLQSSINEIVLYLSLINFTELFTPDRLVVPTRRKEYDLSFLQTDKVAS